MDKLTDRQRKFVNEYLVDLNATQAAIRAGFAEKTANRAASRLLSNVVIQSEIQKRMKDREKRTEITQDRVLRELAAIGFYDITDFLSVRDGNLCVKDTSEISKSKIPAISRIKATQFGLDIIFNDKVRALEKIGEHLGMWKDNSVNTDALERLDAILSEMRNNANTEQETE